MSKLPNSEVLYIKGMNMSSVESDEDDAWDDKKLTAAYDKALKIANVEVAKRLAMSTNTPSMVKEENSRNKKKTARPDSSKKKDLNGHWKPGMPCRTVYVEDGLEYEAIIVNFVNDKDCVVNFLGYNNSEIVPINSLKPSLGNDERTRQIETALMDKTEDDAYTTNSPNVENMDCSDRVPSPCSIDRSSQKKKKPSKKKKAPSRNMNGFGNMSGFQLPELPMPNISMLRNLASSDMPMPPPPMAFASVDRTDSEDQAISSMLLSWYMSGYYTGLYQGLKRAKENRNNV